MDLTTILFFVLNVIGALISCGASVVSVQNARRPASIELQSSVSELMSAVEKMSKEFRKEKMSRVRKGISESSGDIDQSAPSVPVFSEGQNVRRSKEQLRALMAMKGKI